MPPTAPRRSSLRRSRSSTPTPTRPDVAVITVERHVARPIERVWVLASDFGGLRLPLTRVDRSAGPPGVGWRFVGVSGFGPLAIHDSMLVTRWRPPTPGSDTAEYAVVKTGWVLGGW